MKHRSMTARKLQEENPPSGDEHALIHSERRPPSLNLPSPIPKGTPAPHPGSKGAGPSAIGATHPRVRNGIYFGAPWEILRLTNPLSKDHQEKSPTAAHWVIHEETKLLDGASEKGNGASRRRRHCDRKAGQRFLSDRSRTSGVPTFHGSGDHRPPQTTSSGEKAKEGGGRTSRSDSQPGAPGHPLRPAPDASTARRPHSQGGGGAPTSAACRRAGITAPPEAAASASEALREKFSRMRPPKTC